MNISFMQTWPDKMGKEMAGKPTYFIEKALKSLPDKSNYYPSICENCGWKGMSSLCNSHSIADTGDYTDLICPKCHEETINEWEGLELANNGYYHQSNLNPKPHTIRENKKGRYKAGVILQPYVWTGKPYRSKPFYFCHPFPCRMVQFIQILYIDGLPNVYIGDSKESAMPFYYNDIHDPDNGYGLKQMQELAINDGFKSTEDFFKWFDSDFTGSIIHWTDLKY